MNLFKAITFAFCLFCSTSFALEVVRPPIPGRPIPKPAPAEPTAGTITFQYADNLGTENMSYSLSTYRPLGKLKVTLNVQGSDGNIIFQPTDNGKEETIEAKKWTSFGITLDNPTTDPEAAAWMSQFNGCISSLTKGPEIRDAYKKRSANYSISIRLSGAAYNDLVKQIKADMVNNASSLNLGTYTTKIDSLSCNVFAMFQSFR